MSSFIKILLIDDDTDFVDAVKEILVSQSFIVEAAFNKEKAWEKIYSFKPDLIITDIMMERITDGFDLCYDLKHDPDLKNIPVLAISSITSKTHIKYSPETDGEYFAADAYLEKPVKPELILEEVFRLLEKRRKVYFPNNY